MLVNVDVPNGRNLNDEEVILLFSPGGKRLAMTYDSAPWALVFDAATGRETHRFTGLERAYGLFFLNEDRLVIFAGPGSQARNLKRGGRVVRWGGEQIASESAAISPDRSLAALGHGPVRLVDLAKRKVVQTLRTVLDNGVSKVAFSPDGRLVAADSRSSYSRGGTEFVQVWDVRTGRKVRLYEAGGQGTEAIAFHPSDGSLALAVDSSVMIYGPDEAEAITHYSPTSVIRNLRYSPDGRSLEVVAFDGEMARVEPRTGRVLARSGPPEGREVHACAVSEGGMAAGVVDGALLFWELPRGDGAG